MIGRRGVVPLDVHPGMPGDLAPATVIGDEAPQGPTPSRRRSRRNGPDSAAPFLDRPLTSFHLIVGSTLMLVLIGLVMVWSASSVVSLRTTGDPLSVVKKQAFYAVIGLIAFGVAMRLPVRIWRRLATVTYLAVTLALIAVLLIGSSAKGAQRWIDIGPVQLQPSEMAKVALVLWGADLLARKHRRGLLRQTRHLLIPVLPGGMLICALVLAEPDLGTTIVLASIIAALLYVAGLPGRVMALLGVLGVAGLAMSIMGAAYRMDRFRSFWDPFADPNTGYQARHGLYALASGGLFGVGLGESKEKWLYLPEAHNDFILAIVGEELGLVGVLTIIGLLAVLVYGGLRVALRTPDPFARFAAFATTSWIGIQALINIGAVLTLLPPKGIPLPLISYGGTALILTLVSCGLLCALALTEPGAAEASAANRARRRRRKADAAASSGAPADVAPAEPPVPAYAGGPAVDSAGPAAFRTDATSPDPRRYS